jgi:uncharacterized protein YggE
MSVKQAIAAFAILAGSVLAGAQQTTQVELKIEGSNRTLSVNAEERVTADPEIAILHIGFETKPSDAKSAYAAGAKTSNEIVGALKQAGIPETSIRSETQHLERVYTDSHKFKLVQQWTVKAPPERAAETLDVAVAAGATDSGQIDWTVQDVEALESQALGKAAARAKGDAAALANSMGVHLGRLIYVTNHLSSFGDIGLNGRNFASLAQVSEGFADKRKEERLPLSIEPHKVSRTASVYAVFAIE